MLWREVETGLPDSACDGCLKLFDYDDRVMVCAECGYYIHAICLLRHRGRCGRLQN
jgi:hypothetical protein